MDRIATMRINTGQEMKKVVAIKSLRGLTNWGLKESKTFVDDLVKRPGSFKIPSHITTAEMTRWLNDINDSGHTITISSVDSPIRRELNKQLNATLTYASLAGEYDVVRAITDMLEIHLTFEEPEKENND